MWWKKRKYVQPFWTIASKEEKKLKYRPNTSPSLAASSAVQSAASIASLSHGSRVGCVHLGHRVLNICANNHHSLHKYISTRQFLAATETTTAPSLQLSFLSLAQGWQVSANIGCVRWFKLVWQKQVSACSFCHCNVSTSSCTLANLVFCYRMRRGNIAADEY